MALRDPVAVYNAADNMQAHLVRNALLRSGIEAFVTEDVSVEAPCKPRVWVERTDIERARFILEDYERRSAERRANGRD